MLLTRAVSTASHPQPNRVRARVQTSYVELLRDIRCGLVAKVHMIGSDYKQHKFMTGNALVEYKLKPELRQVYIPPEDARCECTSAL